MEDDGGVGGGVCGAEGVGEVDEMDSPWCEGGVDRVGIVAVVVVDGVCLRNGGHFGPGRRKFLGRETSIFSVAQG